MLTLSEIETAIQQLPETEIRELVARLHAHLNDLWDHQLESDLASGKLDSLLAKAEAHIAADRVRDLDEVLYNT